MLYSAAPGIVLETGNRRTEMWICARQVNVFKQGVRKHLPVLQI